MADRLTFDEVEELQLVELNGNRLVSALPETFRVQAELKFSPNADGNDPRGTFVTMKVETHDAANEGDASPAYKGRTTYYVRTKSELPEGDEWQVVDLVWPLLRVAAMEHSSRLGLPIMPLQLALDVQGLASTPAVEEAST